MTGGFTERWFVLTYKKLTCYKNSTEMDEKLVLPIEGLKWRATTDGNKFELVNPTRRSNLYKGKKSISLSCESNMEFNSWKKSFSQGGVYPENESLAVQVIFF